MSNSSLVSVTVKSPNNSGQRTMKIDRITPHCVVGQMGAASLGNWFAKKTTQASSNYGIGYDGKIGLYVDESCRSWCSSSAANDQRAVTIECASETYAPYAMKDAVYASLVKLCVDICKRNGKTKLLWLGDKAKTLAYTPKSDEMLLTVHRWFANKSCPGDWLYSRLGDLAAKVTKELKPKEIEPITPPIPPVLTAGTEIQLSNEPLYISATAAVRSRTVTGTYYFWGGSVINGRIRITNAKSRVGINGQVTGWINAPQVVLIYKVKAGDTLGKIANANNITLKRLLEFNPQITNPDLIHVGDLIKIPVK